MSLAPAVRAACARVARRARQVRVVEDAIEPFAASLGTVAPYPPPAVEVPHADEEATAAFLLTFDAINFGSGWFPTLRKRAGRSGALTIMLALRDRFEGRGAWTARELAQIDQRTVAQTLGQDPAHELMALYAEHLRELGRRVGAGTFLELATRPQLAAHLATWPTFADVASYDGEPVPLFKRAQLTAYDMVCAGLAPQGSEGALTIFADNLVPHVLRLEGVLDYDPELVARIERTELLVHGSPEEVEIRACAVHAVELVTDARPDLSAPAVDTLLWHRGQEPRFKAVPRHRARCSAY